MGTLCIVCLYGRLPHWLLWRVYTVQQMCVLLNIKTDKMQPIVKISSQVNVEVKHPYSTLTQPWPLTFPLLRLSLYWRHTVHLYINIAFCTNNIQTHDKSCPASAFNRNLSHWRFLSQVFFNPTLTYCCLISLVSYPCVPHFVLFHSST